MINRNELVISEEKSIKEIEKWFNQFSDLRKTFEISKNDENRTLTLVRINPMQYFLHGKHEIDEKSTLDVKNLLTYITKENYKKSSTTSQTINANVPQTTNDEAIVLKDNLGHTIPATLKKLYASKDKLHSLDITVDLDPNSSIESNEHLFIYLIKTLQRKFNYLTIERLNDHNNKKTIIIRSYEIYQAQFAQDLESIKFLLTDPTNALKQIAKKKVHKPVKNKNSGLFARLFPRDVTVPENPTSNNQTGHQGINGGIPIALLLNKTDENQIAAPANDGFVFKPPLPKRKDPPPMINEEGMTPQRRRQL